MKSSTPTSLKLIGSDAMSVPVVESGTVLGRSENLAPQTDWTFEAWIKPYESERRRVVTFCDPLTPVPAGAPSRTYFLSVDGQSALMFGDYEPKSKGSYFQTGTDAKGKYSFAPGPQFTWEFWVQPAEDPASTGFGGIIHYESQRYSSIRIMRSRNSLRGTTISIRP